MDCATARSLIDQDVTPNASAPVRALLGFHVAACAPCRAYQRQAAAQHLLQHLLTAPGPRAVLAEPPAARPAPRMRPQPRFAIGAALIVCACVALLLRQQPMGAAVLAAPAPQAAPQIAPVSGMHASLAGAPMLVALLNQRVLVAAATPRQAFDDMDESCMNMRDVGASRRAHRSAARTSRPLLAPPNRAP